MRKLKAKEWLQFVLMLPLVIWAVPFLGRWGSLSLDNMGISAADVCFSHLYTYSGLEPYIAALCTVPNEGVTIVRANVESLSVVATNHPVDVIAILIVFFASLFAWGLLLKRVIVTNVRNQ